MNLLTDKTIAIIGGGPGGLTLARLLQLKGVDVKVYERDTHRLARPQGATLDLHDESGLKALEAAGLMNEFNANYRPGAGRLRIVDKNAQIIFEDSELQENDRNRPEIDRGPLQNLLLDSLKTGTVAWDHRLVSLTQNNGVFKLEFEKGCSEFADIIIGADGANSRIRSYLTPTKPFYSSVMVIEGSVYNSVSACPDIHKLLNGGKIFALSDSKSLIVSSKGDGSFAFYLGFKADENWAKNSGIDFNDKQQVFSLFNDIFAGWSEIWHQLFDNAEPKFAYRPQYCMPLDQSWQAQPNLTLLGDAAHLMPPFAGEGVNMAMLDALELSEHLTSTGYPDLQSAIAAYELQMRARASEAAAITMESTHALHSPDALEYISAIVG